MLVSELASVSLRGIARPGCRVRELEPGARRFSLLFVAKSEIEQRAERGEKVEARVERRTRRVQPAGVEGRRSFAKASLGFRLPGAVGGGRRRPRDRQRGPRGTGDRRTKLHGHAGHPMHRRSHDPAASTPRLQKSRPCAELWFLGRSASIRWERRGLSRRGTARLRGCGRRMQGRWLGNAGVCGSGRGSNAGADRGRAVGAADESGARRRRVVARGGEWLRPGSSSRTVKTAPRADSEDRERDRGSRRDGGPQGAAALCRHGRGQEIGHECPARSQGHLTCGREPGGRGRRRWRLGPDGDRGFQVVLRRGG